MDHVINAMLSFLLIKGFKPSLHGTRDHCHGLAGENDRLTRRISSYQGTEKHSGMFPGFLSRMKTLRVKIIIRENDILQETIKIN